MISLAQIEEARRRLGDAVRVTPSLIADSVTECLGGEVWFKYETLQKTGSFKVRGALNKILSLSEGERSAGVIAASAGNHAQGVAYGAASVGCPATIVMPEHTPQVKIRRTRELGAEVVLHGRGFDDAYERAREIEADRGLTLVHPFEQDEVIAGQGTIGLEILEQIPDVEAVLVSVGGGGLISGIATAVKSLRPDVAVYGVQSDAAPAMHAAVAAGRIVPTEVEASIADGIAVKSPGRHTLEHIQEYVDRIELVSESAIEEAIHSLLQQSKVVVEGAGAAPLAGLLSGRFPELAGRRVAVVLSGANIDLNILGRIVERSLVRQNRLVRLGLSVEDRPGSLAGALSVIAAEGANVLRIHHNRAFTETDFWDAEVEVTLETRDHGHIERVIEALRIAGFDDIRAVNPQPIGRPSLAHAPAD